MALRMPAVWQQGRPYLARCLVAQRSFFAVGHSTPRQASKVNEAIAAETRRQRDELILIPSESICFPECEQIMASPFGNIYAEGQPDLRLCRDSPSIAMDDAYFHAWHRRLSDARFYRGCNESDRVELLAKYYIAQAFSLLKDSPSANEIHANVQALSGSPANLAIYQALMGDQGKLLTLHLSHGGHLSHGSPFNVSGKRYSVAQYEIDSNTRVLDYDAIHRLAESHRPDVMVAGASAYPWDFQWDVLRQIADDVGAYLHADVCHLAGLIIAGKLNNPLPYADTVMFTTHKTLMGPRGSVIVSKNKDIARKIDNAVFPGMQGGPHMNNIAGIARMFEMIVQNRDDYCKLQQNILDNCQVMADEFVRCGFRLEYGGTENHLLLLDLRTYNVKKGNALDGETASRLLENVGIITNKNTLPGDATAADSNGLRLATPWLTQRGVTQEQMRELVQIIHLVLSSAHGFQVWAPSGDEKCRARLPFEVLLEARRRVRALAHALPYPAFDEAKYADVDRLAGAAEVQGHVALRVRGEKARLALEQALTCDVLSLGGKQVAGGKQLDHTGSEIATAYVSYLGWHPNQYAGPNGEEQLALFVPKDKAEVVLDWLTALSDGYVLLDEKDPYLKVDGPFVVEPLEEKDLPFGIADATFGTASVDVRKPFFVGQAYVPHSEPALPKFEYAEPEGAPKRTVLYDWHVANGGNMVPFGGWDMPLHYDATIAQEGPNALPFVETVLANSAARLVDNEAQYTYMVDPQGQAFDDAYAYRLGRENYMIVYNAGNFERDYAWLEAVNEGRVMIDAMNPHKKLLAPASLFPLRDAGRDALLDIAFQGRESMNILSRVVDSEHVAELRRGKLNDIHHVSANGIKFLAARTGYTGEEVGYELFIHPDDVQSVWNIILDVGKDAGVRAAGLGARDSCRIQAGFPLFGHELEGPEKLSLTEAGYGYVSRFHRPFYVGRDPYIERTSPRRKHLVRLQGSGRKSARVGHCVVDDNGNVVGVITSFAYTDDAFNYTALAAIDTAFTPSVGSHIRVARVTKDKAGDKPIADSKCIEVEVKSRFPTAQEKSVW